MFNMECHHEVKVPSPCYNFSQSESSCSASNKPHHYTAERSNYSTLVNTSTSDNSPSADNPSESEESFEFINGESDDVNYVIEVKTCHDQVSAVSLNDTQESNYKLTATESSANANFPSKDCLVHDEPFELINRTPDDLVHVMKILCPSSTSNMKSQCADDEKIAVPSSVSDFSTNTLSVDSDESFELINRTPDDSAHVMKILCPSSTSNMKSQCVDDEKIAEPSSASDFSTNTLSVDSDESFELICICAKETQKSSNYQGNVSPCSACNMKSVNNTVFKKKCSSPTEMCTNNDESKQESKILGAISDKRKTAKSKNIPGDSEKIFPDRLVMEGLIKGVKNCDIAEKRLNDANNRHNQQIKASVSVHDEGPNPENKNLFLLTEKRDVPIPANVCKEIRSDMVKKVTKGIQNCSISDKQFDYNTAAKGVKNCDIAEKKLIDANDKHNQQIKANVSEHDERPNPENKNLFHLAEKRDVSIPANVCKEICSDMVKKVTKGIENCSLSDKQFNSSTAIDKNYSNEFKTNLNTNKQYFVLPKNNLTSTITSNRKRKPKYRKTDIVAKGTKRIYDEFSKLLYAEENKINCDKQQSQVNEEMSNDSLKNVSNVKKEDMLEVGSDKKDSTSINKLDEKYEPKYNETIFDKDNEMNNDKPRSQVYEVVSDGKREDNKNGNEEFFLSRPPKFCVKRELPEGVYILKSETLCYLNKLEQTLDDKDGFKSEYADFWSEEGYRRLQESKLWEKAKKSENKRETTKRPMPNSTHKLKNGKKIFSWRGFDIDF